MNHKIEFELVSLSASVSRINGLCRQWGLKNGALHGVVQILYILRFKEPVTQKQISEYCELPKQTINNVVKQFKDAEYIEFETSVEDKHQKLIRLTALGADYAERTLEPFFKLNLRVYERLGLSPVRNLASGLSDLGDAIELEMQMLELDFKWGNREAGKNQAATPDTRK
jgi:DNA-binding MarR family transcriptional regulator